MSTISILSRALVCLACFAIVACAPTVKVRPIDAAAQAKSGVFLTQQTLPTTAYTPIADIRVAKQWYGGTDEMLTLMAKQARDVGADAVIDVKTWQAPNWGAWAAPHASGKAIKLKDRSMIESGQVQGDWR